MSGEATVVVFSVPLLNLTVRVVPSCVIVSTDESGLETSVRSWLYVYGVLSALGLMNVQRTASPKTARTTSTTLLRTMRLVKLGLLSPPCERRGPVAAKAGDHTSHRPGQYMGASTAEQTADQPLR